MNIQDCITWKHAFIGLAMLTTTTGGILAWANDQHDWDDTHVSLVQYQSMEEDIKAIKKCVINGECRP